jgi:CBS domain-containing protein
MIFTHGDFVRHFQSDSKIGERLVADLMTSNPVTVHKEKLVAEVLNLLERHRIDDLVAIDESNVAAPAHEKDRCGKTLPFRLRSGQAPPASNGAWKVDCLKQSSSEAVHLIHHDSASRRRPQAATERVRPVRHGAASSESRIRRRDACSTIAPALAVLRRGRSVRYPTQLR